MQRGVQPHERIASRPVDLEREALANLGERAAGRDEMGNGARCRALARVGHGDLLAVLADELADVARLSAAERIEDRPVELDLAVLHADDPRCGGFQVRIIAKQEFGQGITPKGTVTFKCDYPVWQ